MLLAVSRLMFAWAQDGIFPSAVAAVHPTRRTPHVAILASAGMATLGVLGSHLAGDFFLGVDILVTSMLFNFLLMSASVLALPARNPALAAAVQVLPSRAVQAPAGGGRGARARDLPRRAHLAGPVGPAGGVVFPFDAGLGAGDGGRHADLSARAGRAGAGRRRPRHALPRAAAGMSSRGSRGSQGSRSSRRSQAVAVERIAVAPGLEVARVLTGLWQIADMERDGRSLDLEKTADAMQAYVAAGLTGFDMADHYGSAEDVTGLSRQRHDAAACPLLHEVGAQTRPGVTRRGARGSHAVAHPAAHRAAGPPAVPCLDVRRPELARCAVLPRRAPGGRPHRAISVSPTPTPRT